MLTTPADVLPLILANGTLAGRLVAFIMLRAAGGTNEVGHGLTAFVEHRYSIGAAWMSVEYRCSMQNRPAIKMTATADQRQSTTQFFCFSVPKLDG